MSDAAARDQGLPAADWAPPAFLPPADAETSESDGRREYRRAHYAEVPGFRPLELDLTVPVAAAPVPVVLWIHGGAWLGGTNRAVRGAVPTAAIRDALVERGIAVASVQYRHSGEARFPGCFQDLVAAVRWLRHFAGELGLDPGRLGTWGESAGGHLAVLLALNIPDPELLGDLGVRAGDTTVQAGVGWYAPSDLLSMQEQTLDPDFPDHDAPDSPESLLVGAPVQTVPDLVRRASPVTYASDAAAPLLLLHGAADVVVSPRQSEELAQALRDAGAEVELELVPGANHVFGGVDPLPIVERSATFLAERLAG